MRFQKGNKINVGREHSEETKKRMSEVHKGISRRGTGWTHSEETKKKMRESRKNQVFSEETRRKIGEAHKGKKGYWLGKKKPPFTAEHRKNLSNCRRGKDNPNWKGGVTPINKIIRTSKEYALWRIAVFERDNYTCIWCGIKSGKGTVVILHADHSKPFADYPELRFAIDNGRTLCRECHLKTETYGARKKYYEYY